MDQDKLREYITNTTMQLSQKVNSSNIKALAYNAEYAVLEVEFWGIKDKPPRRYRYWPVNILQWQELIKAESVGNYFSTNIRNIEGITTVQI